MPRPRDEVSAPAAQMPAGGGPQPPPVPPPFGPPVPTPTLGPRGRARFDAEVASMRFGTQMWDHRFNQWVLSLQEDPNDPEYNAVLQWAKANAQRHENGLASAVTGTSPLGTPAGVVDPLKPGPASRSAGADSPVFGPPVPTSEPASGEGAVTVADPDAPPAPAITPEEEQAITGARKVQKDLYKRPVFRGRPVGSDELYDPTGPGAGTPAPALDEWLSQQGIPLPGDDRSRALLSGNYVYMGKERHATLGVERDVYMYLDNAQAAGQRVDPKLLASYQQQLGLTVNGKMDPILQGYWDEAVKQARNSAITGIQMSVQEWFDIIMASVIAQKNARGGGGGGGGGGAARKEEFDYYREMMQILGDISGVSAGG